MQGCRAPRSSLFNSADAFPLLVEDFYLQTPRLYLLLVCLAGNSILVSANGPYPYQPYRKVWPQSESAGQVIVSYRANISTSSSNSINYKERDAAQCLPSIHISSRSRLVCLVVNIPQYARHFNNWRLSEPLQTPRAKALFSASSNAASRWSRDCVLT